MKKSICFDMDGTIADLYNVEGWLNDLRDSNARPYREAAPMVNMLILKALLIALKKEGYVIGVISWGSKESTREYGRAVRATKIEWLKAQGIYDCIDYVHVVKYGTAKSSVDSRLCGGLLFDDSEAVCEDWNAHYDGVAVDPRANDILEMLSTLIAQEQ